MSAMWDRHYATIQDLLRRNAPLPWTPPPPAPVPGYTEAADGSGGWDMPEGGYGGAPGYGGASGSPAGGNWGLNAAMPNAMSIAQATDMNPGVARAGMGALGMAIPGPAGFAIGGLNALGNVANTASNLGMLHDLGVVPGGWSTFGGLLGGNALAGNYTGALNAAMAQQMPGFAGMSPPQVQGVMDVSMPTELAPVEPVSAESLGGMDSGGGWGADVGYGGFEGWGGFQHGGYTGAGQDGVVQPGQPAGVVHEGEIVLPAWLVRGLLSRMMQ